MTFLNLGCTNVNACNYDPTVCVDVPASCVFCLDHCFTLQMVDAEGNGWEGVTWHLSNNQGQTLDAGTLQNGYNALDAGCLEDGCYTSRSDRLPGKATTFRGILQANMTPLLGGARRKRHLRIQRRRRMHDALGLQLRCGGLRGRRVVRV